MASTYADLHIKVNPEIKTESEKILDQIGISMTDLVNMTLRRLIRERQIPFSTRVEEDIPESLRVDTKEQLLERLDKIAELKDEDYMTSEEV